MSGHSKWSTIKHKKAAEDSKKGKVFGEVARLIRVAVKNGKTGDPGMNPGLRLALDKARAVNMPKENIDRAIKKGLGRSENGAVVDEVVYEGYGPGGVGFRVVAVTDNRNRTGAEIRSTFERHDGSLGGPGSSAYLFEIADDGGAKATITIPVTDEGVASAVEKLVDELSEREDVEMVAMNMVRG